MRPGTGTENKPKNQNQKKKKKKNNDNNDDNSEENNENQNAPRLGRPRCYIDRRVPLFRPEGVEAAQGAEPFVALSHQLLPGHSREVSQRLADERAQPSMYDNNANEGVKER